MRAVASLVFAVVMAVPAVHAETLQVSVPDPEKEAGPQKVIRYMVDVRNVGDRRLEVRFEVADRPVGGWNVLVPSNVLLDPGQSVPTTVAVTTPYDTGYNDEGGRFLLRAVPYDPATGSPAGDPSEFELTAGVEGWYLPGPGLPLAAAALLGLALLARRRPG